MSFHNTGKHEYPLLFSPHPLLFQAVGASILAVKCMLKYGSYGFKEILCNLI